MKRLQILPLLLGLLFVANAGIANAQTAGATGGAEPTRTQIKMERDEFLKTHRFDAGTDTWMVTEGADAPAGVKTRTEIKSERDEFLRNNRWDEARSTWVPLKGKPRDISTMSRAQVRAETRQFVRTHRWDGATQAWVEAGSKKK